MCFFIAIMRRGTKMVTVVLCVATGGRWCNGKWEGWVGVGGRGEGGGGGVGGE